MSEKDYGLAMVMLPGPTVDLLRRISEVTEQPMLEIISLSIAEYAKRCGVPIEESGAG